MRFRFFLFTTLFFLATFFSYASLPHHCQTSTYEEFRTAESEQNTWYTLNAVFEDDVVTVTCTSEVAGTPMATLSGTSDLLDTLDNETDTVGFTVSKLADYHFRALEYVTVPNATINHVKWDYDPYGRKIARTEYDGAGAVLNQTRYVYDGWQLVQEIDVLNGNTVLAEYVYGPGYIDDVIQSSHGGNTYYHHTDQQYSTVAVTDGSGTVVERYGYDAFGNPAIYDATGTALPASAINNSILYTGRNWQPELGLYDYRNRMYDPVVGRFTTPDPLGTHGDWNNLGNAYTYVGNNPAIYLDPLGLEGSLLDRSVRVAKTGVIVGLNVAAWGLTGPLGGAPVTGITLALGGGTSYYSRQSQYRDATGGQALPLGQSTIIVAGDLSGASALYGLASGEDPLTGAAIDLADRIESGAHLAVGFTAAYGMPKVTGRIAGRVSQSKSPTSQVGQ